MNKKGYLQLGVVVLFAMCVAIFVPGFFDDINCWRRWALQIHEHGLRNVYDSDTNYLPLYQYVLWFYAKICGSREAIEGNVFLLKWITLFFECFGFYLVYKWVSEKKDLVMVMLLGLLNVGAAYNNIIWGQVDGILATLVFAAVYYAYKGRLIVSSVWITLALLFKLQAICFLPLWGLVFLFRIFEKGLVKLFVKSILATIATILIVTFPFMLKPGGLLQVWNVYTGFVDSVPRLALGAFNFWSWTKSEYLGNYSDKETWLGNISYKTAGTILFVSAMFFTVLPLLTAFWRRAAQRQPVIIHRPMVLIIGALSCLVFYYFNTQMHERYSHPAFIFILAYAIYTKDIIPYILFTAAYFLNMEAILHKMSLSNYGTAIFHQKVISGIYALNILYLFIQLYRLPIHRHKQRHGVTTG